MSLRFSVVIPTYNRPEALAICLESLGTQTFARDRFEVIVVDDGSPGEIAGLVTNSERGYPLRIIRQANLGPARARNRGIQEAKGAYVAFTDDDCRPDPDWLVRLDAAFVETPQAAVGGRTVNALPNDRYAATSQLLIDYLYEYYGARLQGHAFFTSNNLAFPIKELRQLGGFDTNFALAAGEDRDLCDRWIESGRALVFEPSALIHHAHHLQLRTFVRQHFHYGRGAFQYHSARKAHGQGLRRLEPLRFYSGLLGYPFSARRARPLSLASLLFLSQVANALGYFRERLRRGP